MPRQPMRTSLRLIHHSTMRFRIMFRRYYMAALVKFLIFVLFVTTVTLYGLVYFADYSPSRLNRLRILDESKATLRNCTTKANIYFVKTHKTGGSTVQNVLMRFGASRNLDFAMPLFGNHHIHVYSLEKDYNVDFKEQPMKVMLPPGGSSRGYNVSCFHGIFNASIAAELVPAKDTVYITILRDPVDAFESLYSFMKFDTKYGMDIEQFAYADKTKLSDEFFLKRSYNYMGANQMVYDLGMDSHRFDDATAVDEYIDFIVKQFSLVMIQEHFDESMILLRDLMCWDTDDIIHLKHNVRDGQHRPRRMSSGAAERIRAMNSADQRLYDYFRKRFDEALASYGKQKMTQEVQLFRKRVEEMQTACIQATVPSDQQDHLSSRFRPWSEKVSGFLLRPEVEGNDTCEQLAMPELSFMGLLKRKQFARAALGFLKVP